MSTSPKPPSESERILSNIEDNASELNRELQGLGPEVGGSEELAVDAVEEAEELVPAVEQVEERTIQYTKRSREEYNMLRRKFNSSIRRKFLKELADKQTELLKKIGLNNSDIKSMEEGGSPLGWEVHHKLPLDDGGDNDFDNLVLLTKKDHVYFTKLQLKISRNLQIGETKSINFLIPKDSVLKPGIMLK